MKNSKSLATSIVFLYFMAFFLPSDLYGQQDIKALEQQLETTEGAQKIELYNQIINHYQDIKNARKAQKYAEELGIYVAGYYSSKDFVEPDILKLKIESLFNIGKAQKESDQFLESKDAFQQVILLSGDEDKYERFSEMAEEEIDNIEDLIVEFDKDDKGLFGKAFKDIGSFIDKATGDIDFETVGLIELAEALELVDDYDGAIKNFEVAIKKLKEKDGKDEKIQKLEGRVEKLKGLASNRKERREIRQINKINGPRKDIVTSAATRNPEIIIRKPNEQTPRKTSTPPATAVRPATPTPRNPEAIKLAAKEAAEKNDFKKSTNYYEEYIELENQLNEERNRQSMATIVQKNELEKRDREIKLYQQNEQIGELEIEKQRAAKRTLGFGLGLLGLVLLSVFRLFVNKRKAHDKLGLAYNELQTTQDNLKTAQSKIKALLDQQVSGAVANQLLASPGDQKIERRFVCIMFLDIRDFTVFAEKRNPEEIIDYQNNVFGFMIETINKHNGIVNQILGDGFMATFGAPHTSGHDCNDAYAAAQEIIAMVKSKSASGEIPPTKVGIGLHAGYVVTGNVGTQKRKQYSITGNPVIVASRLEQLNKEFGSSIVISKNVYDQLSEDTRSPMEFNEVTVKGRSEPVSVATLN